MQQGHGAVVATVQWSCLFVKAVAARCCMLAWQYKDEVAFPARGRPTLHLLLLAAVGCCR
jgi:hypothetical protein